MFISFATKYTNLHKMHAHLVFVEICRKKLCKIMTMPSEREKNGTGSLFRDKLTITLCESVIE